MGFYSVTPLTPGGWSELLDQAGLPRSLRRLNDTVVIGRRRRSVDFRCLTMMAAFAYLLDEPADADSASVRAWRLAARVVEQTLASGGSVPDLGRFAAAFPATAHALAQPAVDPDAEPEPMAAAEAVATFVDASMRALATAVREPRLLTAADAHADVLDLDRLQPSLRAVAPDLGAVAPVVRLRDALELTLELELPEPGEDLWPLRAEPADPVLLRRASHIFPPLALMRDGRIAIDTETVVELRMAAPALEFAGAVVRLPAEVEGETDLDVEDAELRFASGNLALDGSVHFDLRASLGGHEISREEFRALAAASVPLVRVGGGWRTLSAKALVRARSLAQVALHGSTLPGLTALGAALGGASELRGLTVGVAATDGAIGELADQLRSPQLRAPAEAAEGFHGQLRPYQEVGLGWLLRMRGLGLGALLADDMGLGKTVQVIAYLVDRSDDDGRSTLIVAPTSVLGNWERELHRFAPGLSVHVHHGPDRTHAIDDLTRHDVVITSYALLPRDRKLLERTGWRALVLDEAQAVKNPLTRAAQAARSLAAANRVALTGTPVENRLDDLWSIMQILNPGLLGTRTGFRRLVATPIERHHDAEAEERLRRVTGPFLLRRRKSDPLVLPDLPPRQDSTEYCTLTLEQASLYQATIDAIMGQVRGSSGIQRRGHVLALITRLKQVCNHPVHASGKPGTLAGRSGKLDRLIEMLSEAVAEGDSALVFTQYAVMGNLLAGHVEHELSVERLYLDGSVPRRRREEIVDRFQQNGGVPRVLVASLRAGGTGLNLTAANHVFHFDRWWNPAVEDQAFGSCATGSGRRGWCRCTGWCAPARSRSGSTS